MKNALYYGDNLVILREYIPDSSIDLVYLDPPFKSNQDYNVLFKTRSGKASPAQIRAFKDTWKWDTAAARAYDEITTSGLYEVAQVMQAFRTMIGENDVLAYLSMMAPRLVELHRVLKDTGSLYLHCDPTASHYLKLLLDAIFGPIHFKNELIWKRTSAHSSAKRFGPIHDVLLFYTKTDSYTWNEVFQPYDESYIESFYRHEDEQGKHRLSDLTAAGTRHGDSGEAWRGINPTDKGRHWAVPGYAVALFIDPEEAEKMSTQEKLDELDKYGRIYWPPKGSVPQYKRYLDEMPGVPIQDVVTDIQPIASHAKERLGYPTQKPEALLDRVIEASSSEGDIVLDPFCGCGTAVVSAEKLRRKWIGIDITHLATTLIKHRLRDAFGDDLEYDVIGEPTTWEAASALAEEDRFQFEYWAVGIVEAQPRQKKKGADRGIDGRILFRDDKRGELKQVILSVKSGKNVGVSDVRDLRGVVEREKAAIGALITLYEPTEPMRREAASAGFYSSPGWGTKHPHMQILTVRELLSEKRIDMPPIRHVSQTFKRAPRAVREEGTQREIFGSR